MFCKSYISLHFTKQGKYVNKEKDEKIVVIIDCFTSQNELYQLKLIC